MRSHLLAAMLTLVLVSPAVAETHRIPEANAIVTVDIPDDGWNASKIERGIAVSDDADEIYLSIEAVDAKDLKQAVEAAVAYLNREGVKVDRSTEKKVEGRLGEFPVFDMGWSGKDQDGDVLVHLTVVEVAPERAVLFTYWATPQGDKEHDAAIQKMVKSLKKV